MRTILSRVCVIAVAALLVGASQVCAEPKSMVYVPVIPSVRNAGSWADEVYTLNQILGSALDRMDDDSTFRMSLGSPAFFDVLRRTAPGVFAEIRKRADSGALEPLGGMWAEIDPSSLDEEPLVRSVLYGRNALAGGLGKEPSVFSLDGSIAYPTAMSQILSGAGYGGCVANVDRNPGFYRWASRNNSGLNVLALIPSGWALAQRPSDSELPPPEPTTLSDTISVSLISPTRSPNFDRWQLPAYKQARFSSVSEILSALQSQGAKPKPIDRFSELSSPAIPGDPGIVLYRRRTAAALSFFERFSALAWARGRDDKTDFGQLWQDTLSKGSEQETRRTLTRVSLAVKNQTKDLTDWLTSRLSTMGDGIPIAVFNSQGWTRTDTVECPAPFPGERVNVALTDDRGKRALGQNHGSSLRFTARDVPPFGCKVFWAKRANLSTWPTVVASSTTLENQFLRVKVDPHGGAVTSVFDKLHNVELLKTPGFGKPELIKSLTSKTPQPLNEKSEVVMMERGPARARFTSDYLYSDCQFTNEVLLYDGTPRVDVRMTIEWDANRPSEEIARIALPISGSGKLICDAAFGGRVLNPKSAFFPAMRWLRFPDSGTTLLADLPCVYQLRNGRLQAVVKGPKDAVTTGLNQYTIDFTYSLYAGGDDARPSTTTKRAVELNEPMVAVVADRHKAAWGSSMSFLSVSQPGAIVCGVKRSESGSDLIVRLYDADGSPSSVRIRPSFTITTCVETDLIERETGKALTPNSGVYELKLGAHEIKTVELKLKR